MKESDWPLHKTETPHKKLTGVLLEPICLAYDLDESLALRVKALQSHYNCEIKPPLDKLVWATWFLDIPGLWPLGWSPFGPVAAKSPRGCPKEAPECIVEDVNLLWSNGWKKKNAIWAELHSWPDYKHMKSPAAIKAAYHREKNKPLAATGNSLTRAFHSEDENGYGFFNTPDDELTQVCLQNWSNFMALLVAVCPDQADTLLRYRSFWLRPIILSRYIYGLEVLRVFNRCDPSLLAQLKRSEFGMQVFEPS